MGRPQTYVAEPTTRQRFTIVLDVPMSACLHAVTAQCPVWPPGPPGVKKGHHHHQDGPRAPKTSPRQPKTAPRWPQDRPRGPKTTPRRPQGPQDVPKTAQDDPETAPRPAKRHPRRHQDGPRRLPRGRISRMSKNVETLNGNQRFL